MDLQNLIKLKNMRDPKEKNKTNCTRNIAVGALLFFVFIVCVLSIIDDSLTMDELAHLPAGYSYLTQQDINLMGLHS